MLFVFVFVFNCLVFYVYKCECEYMQHHATIFHILHELEVMSSKKVVIIWQIFPCFRCLRLCHVFLNGFSPIAGCSPISYVHVQFVVHLQYMMHWVLPGAR